MNILQHGLSIAKEQMNDMLREYYNHRPTLAGWLILTVVAVIVWAVMSLAILGMRCAAL